MEMEPATEMELTFWRADGPNGEAAEQTIRVPIYTLLAAFERYRTAQTVLVTLERSGQTTSQKVVWTRKGYTSGTT